MATYTVMMQTLSSSRGRSGEGGGGPRRMGAEEVLLSLHASPAHNEQQEAWQLDMKAFEELKEDHEAELRRVYSEAYQVISLYAMFQGVIFTAVSQSNLLTCSLAWCPASLSVVASAAAFFAIVDKLKSIGEVKEDIVEVCGNISAILVCLDKLEEQGSEVDLDTVYPQAENRGRKHPGYRFILSRNGASALLFLSLLAALITSFYIHTLCKHCPLSRCKNLSPSPSPLPSGRG